MVAAQWEEYMPAKTSVRKRGCVIDLETDRHKKYHIGEFQLPLKKIKKKSCNGM